jgi:hypothetical protein
LFFENIGIGEKYKKHFPSKQDGTADTDALLQKIFTRLK